MVDLLSELSSDLSDLWLLFEYLKSIKKNVVVLLSNLPGDERCHGSNGDHWRGPMHLNVVERLRYRNGCVDDVIRYHECENKRDNAVAAGYRQQRKHDTQWYVSFRVEHFFARRRDRIKACLPDNTKKSFNIC